MSACRARVKGCMAAFSSKNIKIQDHSQRARAAARLPTVLFPDKMTAQISRHCTCHPTILEKSSRTWGDKTHSDLSLIPVGDKLAQLPVKLPTCPAAFKSNCRHAARIVGLQSEPSNRNRLVGAGGVNAQSECSYHQNNGGICRRRIANT